MFTLDEYTKEILDIIKQLKGDELKYFIDCKIKEQSIISHEMNQDNFIGYDLDINLRYKNIDITSKSNYFAINYNPTYTGYIPDDIKIIYGRYISSTNKMGSKGCFYYLDDNEYLYDFINKIKKVNILDNQTLILLAYFYARKYFGVIGDISRDDLHNLILKENEDCYEPINKHSIKDFKNKSCAMCSEYSAIMQNILSFFGYDISYIFGTSNEHPHAFNMIILNDNYHLLDSSDGINCFKINNKYLSRLPYLIPLDDFQDQDYQDFINEEKEIEVEDYFTLTINNKYYAFPTNDNRRYKVLTKKI